jgi:hypothetical protein
MQFLADHWWVWLVVAVVAGAMAAENKIKREFDLVNANSFFYGIACFIILLIVCSLSSFAGVAGVVIKVMRW